MKKNILLVFSVLFAVALAAISIANAETTEDVFRRYEASLMKNNPQYAKYKQETENVLQPEVNYYETLKTCAPGSFDGDGLSMQTYGMLGGMCHFDLKQKTSAGTKVLCDIKAPILETKKFAENKIKLADSVTGKVRLNSAENTSITNQITLFSNKYCK